MYQGPYVQVFVSPPWLRILPLRRIRRSVPRVRAISLSPSLNVLTPSTEALLLSAEMVMDLIS
jgi:hypothetical protein